MKQRIKNLFVGGVLALAMLGTAAAGPLDDVVAAYKSGNYAEAIRLLRPLAEQGNADAQSKLGFMYEKGQGVPTDYAAALALFRKAAEQGLAKAQSNLGSMYANGEGVLKDYAQAVAWYRKAADQGYALAQHNLGGMYYNGQGVPKDHTQALTWIRKAANQGLAEAQIALGNLYFEGHILPKNYVMADMWFSLAAATEADAAVRNKLAMLRGLLALKMTAAQIDAAKKLASQWRAELQPKVAGLSPPSPELAAQTQMAAIGPPVKYLSEIRLQRQGGTFLIPVSVNGVLTLNFIIDSGASDVSIPGDVFLTLMRSGTIQSEDFLGSRTYTLADGSSVPSETFRIRTLKVGDREIQNVTASVAKVKGDLLLGQSFLTRFKSWSIDNERGVLLLN